MDVLVDIAEIIVKYSLQHSIIAVKESENALFMRIMFEPSHQKVKKNISHILGEYQQYMDMIKDK